MFSPEVRTFLQRPLLARMSVIDAEGYPHTVPVCFVMDGDDVIVTSVRNSAKVRYIGANPRGAITIGGDWADGTGYLLKGDYHVEEDPGLVWLRRTAQHYHTDPAEAARSLALFMARDMVILRLRVQHVVKVL